MKKVYIILSLVLILVLLLLYFFWFTTFVPVKFSSTHPQIAVLKNESKLFNLYANLFLQIKNKDIWGIKPKLIGIIYTDKVRPDNKVLVDSYTQDLGATIDVVNNNEVLIYIFVSDTIVNNGSEKKIKEYTVDTIRYYQDMKKKNKNYLFLNLIKLPIYVKAN